MSAPDEINTDQHLPAAYVVLTFVVVNSLALAGFVWWCVWSFDLTPDAIVSVGLLGLIWRAVVVAVVTRVVTLAVHLPIHGALTAHLARAEGRAQQA